MYAIVETGGKQYKVQPGDVVDVEKLDAEPESIISLDRVLLVNQDGKLTVGAPTVSGATVTATVEGHYDADKIVVFKFRRKVRYRRKRGHRQQFTRLRISDIVAQ
jgi:large subunit ribosomal protein L21